MRRETEHEKWLTYCPAVDASVVNISAAFSNNVVIFAMLLYMKIDPKIDPKLCPRDVWDCALPEAVQQ